MAEQKNPAPATFERTSIDAIDPANINPVRAHCRELTRRLRSFNAGSLPDNVIHVLSTLFEKDRFIGTMVFVNNAHDRMERMLRDPP